MVSWRTAGILWLIGGLISALLTPLMTDPILLVVYAIGAVVGILLAVGCFVRPSARLATWGAAIGAVWLVAYAGIVVANISSGPIEYLVLPVIAALIGAAAGWLSYRIGRGSDASPAPDRSATGT